MKTLNEKEIKDLFEKQGVNSEVLEGINFQELEETVLSCTTTEEALKKLSEKYPEMDVKALEVSFEYAKEELKKQLNQKDSDSEEVVNLEDADLESVAGGSGLGDFFKKHWPAIVTFVGVSALAYFGMKKFTGTSAAGKAAAAEGEAAEAGAATKAANKASVGKGVATGMGFLALGVVPSVLNSLGSDNQ